MALSIHSRLMGSGGSGNCIDPDAPGSADAGLFIFHDVLAPGFGRGRLRGLTIPRSDGAAERCHFFEKEQEFFCTDQ